MSATSPTSKLPATGALEMHEDTALLQVLHWAAKLVESGGAQGAAGPGAPVAPARVTSGRAA